MATHTKVALVAGIVAETFVVTEEEAKQCAEGLVALAEGWGDGGACPSWEDVVQNHFASTLTWRSAKTKERFLQGKRATAAAYERFIQDRK